MLTCGLAADPFKQIQALFVETNNLHLRSTLLQFADQLIERTDAALIPDVSSRHVNGDLTGVVMHVKSLHEIDLADEEQLTGHHVTAQVGRDIHRFHPDHLGHLAAEQDAGQGHTGDHA